VTIAHVEVVAVRVIRVSPPPEMAALRALRGEWVSVLVHGDDGLTGIGG